MEDPGIRGTTPDADSDLSFKEMLGVEGGYSRLPTTYSSYHRGSAVPTCSSRWPDSGFLQVSGHDGALSLAV